MNRYTVCLDELEEHARDVGLASEQAFELILGRAKLTRRDHDAAISLQFAILVG